MKLSFLFFLCCFPLLLLGQSRRPLVWVLDAGHGGHDNGTKGLGVKEKDINLKVMLEVERLIKQHKPGIKVIVTRRKDVFVSLPRRCQIANNARADLFLSIHVNWARDKRLRGTETFYALTTSSMRKNPHAVKSELLSRLLQNNFAASGRPIYRGTRTNRLYVTTHTRMPSALTEIAFISNASDARYITSHEGMMETARIIFNALMEYYTTTQNRTHLKTLSTLRRTGDKKSGVNNSIRVPVKQKAGHGSTRAKERDIEKNSSASNFVETEKKQTTQSSVTKSKNTSSANKKESVQIPTFSIQLFSVASPLSPRDKRLKGLSPVSFVPSGKMYKCLYGGTTDYQKIRSQLPVVRKKFPDAFIVAYMGDQSISTAEALKITKQRK